MVSSLWRACAEGDLEKVQLLFNESPTPDVEIKDHTGVTPLICAIQNGHTEVVRLLLSKGADPMNTSSQGSPESYTTDQAILGLLAAAKNKPEADGHHIETGYPHDPVDPTKAYYPPPPGPYYYPGMPVPPPVHPDGSIAYYPPPHPPADHNGGLPNLPPPDVARMIPCRYFPACRYGTSCIFAHPQTPYLQGPLPPPAQYPTPYDHMNPTPYPSYYTVPPHSFPPPPPNGAPANPVSPTVANPLPLPHPQVNHARSGSELLSPVQTPFSPSGVPPPVPYPVVSPISPSYGHSGPIPVSVAVPPLPPLQHPIGPQSPPHAYPSTSPTAPGSLPPHYVIRRDSVGQQYQPQGMFPNGTADAVTSPKSPLHHAQLDGFGPGTINREVMTHHRRGSARRPSFGGLGRKPPCLFFPSGRCRNGDECRFPHILPDGPGGHHPHPHPHHFSNRGGHRPRPTPHANGVATIEDKFATLNVHEQDGQAAQNTQQTNGASDGSSRSQSTEPGGKGRGYPGPRPHQYAQAPRPDKRPIAPKPQRVPSADEFPVLGGGGSGGGATPPLRGPGVNGPTAAQVLQAPAPARNNSQPGTRGASPEGTSPKQNAKESRIELNGVPGGSIVQDSVTSKLPISFATIAASDVVKEVSVVA